jgi:quinoprotein glucose dehydrogenase
MSRARLCVLAFLACTAAIPRPLDAAPASAAVVGLTPEVMHAAFLPSGIRFSPDGRLFQLELWTGAIRVFPDTLPNTPSIVWATLPFMSEGERGLLSLAFHPQYPDSPYVYFVHTNPADTTNRIVRFRDTGPVGTDMVVLYRNSAQSIFHQGGRIQFGPDGMLYLTYGDQYDPANAQSLSVLPGKILRLTPMGEPAPNNPPLGGLPEIFTYGSRNIFGICFDPHTGQGYFTENGPDCEDEINALVPGANYGWSPAFSCAIGQTFGVGPLIEYTPTISPTGCVIYRDGPIPEFDGSMFFGAFNDGILRRVVFDPDDPFQVVISEQVWAGNGEAILDVIQGPDRALWVATTYSIVRLVRDPLSGGIGDPSPRALRARPNPFGSSVTFTLDGDDAVRSAEILDIAGRLVRRLEPDAGAWRWDGRDADGRPVAAGVYLARIRTDRAEFLERLIRLNR